MTKRLVMVFLAAASIGSMLILAPPPAGGAG